jgi:hypothetical protein
MATAFSAPEGFDPPALTLGDFQDGTWQEKEAAYIASLADLAKMNGTNPLLGEVVRWQRGDGFAEYMVWQTKPLQLIHLGLGDAWQVEDVLIRGLRLADIRGMVDRDKRMREFFARKADER